MWELPAPLLPEPLLLGALEPVDPVAPVVPSFVAAPA
jgi:hypothetical protein